MVPVPDPFHLERFVEAQARDYPQALAELRSGAKTTHWMWYIFPQLRGLGASSLAQFCAISGLPEARAYLAHPILGPRLLQCTEALLALEGQSAREILGTPDDLKLRSCATLFAQAAGGESAFARLLRKYFRGEPDLKSLQILGASPN